MTAKVLYGYVDFGVMLCWWLYLYVFAVIPWQYVAPDSKNYLQAYTIITSIENFVFVGGAILLCMQATGYWRRIYAHLAGPERSMVIRFLVIQLAIARNTYTRGSLYDLPLLVSFLWLGTAGVLAYRNREDEANFASQTAAKPPAAEASASEAVWASRLARRLCFRSH